MEGTLGLFLLPASPALGLQSPRVNPEKAMFPNFPQEAALLHMHTSPGDCHCSPETSFGPRAPSPKATMCYGNPKS